MENEEKKENPGMQEITPGRHSKFRERIRLAYPAENPSDDDAWDLLGEKLATDYDARLKPFQDVVARMNELLAEEPDFAGIVCDMLENGVPFRVAIAKHFSQEDLIPVEGEEDYDAYRQVQDERLKTAQRKEQQGAQIAANEEATLKVIDDYCEQQGMSEQEKDELIEYVNNVFTELLYKRISAEMLAGFVKSMHYDTDVAEAAEVAEIKGRNAAIELKRAADNHNVAGDGIPEVAGGGAVNVKRNVKRNFFDIDERPRI